MNTTRIDLSTWARATHFNFFLAMDSPYTGVTVRVDVTGLKEALKARGVSLFPGMLFLITGAVNDVPELRMRIRHDDDGAYPVLHDRIDAGYTVAAPNELFNYATTVWQDDLEPFTTDVVETSRALGKKNALATDDAKRDHLVFLSCLPWLDFTQVLHATHRNVGDSVPRIAWGKFVEEGERTRCAVNLQVHHALVDGRHMAAFYAALERRIGAITEPAG